MVRHVVGKFNRSFKKAKENGNKNDITECLETILNISKFGYRDDRAFAKISSFMVRFFHPMKCAYIIKAAKEKNIVIKER